MQDGCQCTQSQPLRIDVCKQYHLHCQQISDRYHWLTAVQGGYVINNMIIIKHLIKWYKYVDTG